MSDAPHILKNSRNHLTKGHIILISDEYVQKYNLPTREVSISAIKELHKIDTENKLKLAPRLNERCLNPSHYDSMKLGLACRILDHSVAAAIKYLVEQGDMEKEALTTAWFIKKVFRWFKLMTSRTAQFAMNGQEEVHGNDIEFLRETISLFQHLAIN